LQVPIRDHLNPTLCL